VSEDYKKAKTFFDKKDYKNAVIHYKAAREKGELDVEGHYNLGRAYRALDQCKFAINPLEYVYELSTKNEVWSDQEDIVRKSNYLLARCYAKTNNPGQTELLLGYYLANPKKYKFELEDSLKNPDFGWINASKEWGRYKKDAAKALRR
jgi:hypothetical protein